MSLEGHQTCPHCRALVQSTICTICGKSAFEEIAAPIEHLREKWWTKFENNELRKLGIAAGILVLVGAAAVLVLTRPDAEAVANELPPPASTTTARQIQTPQGEAPSVAGTVRPNAIVAPGAPREVGDALSPWETAPPIDFVTGLMLDETIDFSADIDRARELLTAFPAEWALSELDPPSLLTFGGSLDAAVIESTQPFVARTIRREQDDLEVGELWLIASAGSEAGDAYLLAARARWNVDAALDQFSPEVGVRLWLLGGDDAVNLWAADLEERSLVIIQAPVTIAPVVLTDSLQAWRRTIHAG